MSGRIDFKKSLGNKNLSQMQEQSLAMKDAPTVIMVKLDRIHENPDNNKIYSRKKDDLTNLKTSIKNNGFLGSVILFDLGNGEYEICSGHRRTRAMIELGETSIPATILALPDEAKKAELLLANNQNDRQKTPMDRAREIKYYLDTHKEELTGQRSRDKLAEFFNISPSKVYRYTSLLEVIEELQSLAEDENFPWHTLSEAKMLSEDQQKELYDSITGSGTEDISGPTVKAIINRIKNGSDNIENDENVEEFTEPVIAAEPQIQEVNSDVPDNNKTEYAAPEERNIHDLKEPVVNNKKSTYSKTETGRFMTKMSEIADILQFDNTKIFVDKTETQEWYRRFSELVKEVGNYI